MKQLQRLTGKPRCNNLDKAAGELSKNRLQEAVKKVQDNVVGMTTTLPDSQQADTM